jgi:hypothetical protein
MEANVGVMGMSISDPGVVLPPANWTPAAQGPGPVTVTV